MLSLDSNLSIKTKIFSKKCHSDVMILFPSDDIESQQRRISFLWCVFLLYIEDRIEDKCVVAMCMFIFTAYLTLRFRQTKCTRTQNKKTRRVIQFSDDLLVRAVDSEEELFYNRYQ